MPSNKGFLDTPPPAKSGAPAVRRRSSSRLALSSCWLSGTSPSPFGSRSARGGGGGGNGPELSFRRDLRAGGKGAFGCVLPALRRRTSRPPRWATRTRTGSLGAKQRTWDGCDASARSVKTIPRGCFHPLGRCTSVLGSNCLWSLCPFAYRGGNHPISSPFWKNGERFPPPEICHLLCHLEFPRFGWVHDRQEFNRRSTDTSAHDFALLNDCACEALS